MRRVSVWHVSAVLGGAERSFLDLQGGSLSFAAIHLPADGPLAEELRAGPWQSAVRVTKWPRRVTKLSRTAGIKNLLLLPLASIAILRHLREISRVLKQENAELVYSHGIKNHFLLTPVASFLNIPVLWHLQDYWPRNFLARAFLRFYLRRNLFVICNSQSVADSLGVVSPGRVRVIHNCLNAEDFPYVEPGNTEPSVLGFVGMLVPWKGADVFIDAGKILHQKMGNAIKLVVVGGVPYATDAASSPYYRDLQKKGAGFVDFAGLQRDTAAFFRKMTVFCHTSICPEPFGRVLLEAMASGPIVIAADAGGPREVISDGKTGFLVPPGDPQALAATMQKVLALSLPERQEISLAARKHVEEFFSGAKFRKEVSAFCETIMSQKGGADA